MDTISSVSHANAKTRRPAVFVTRNLIGLEKYVDEFDLDVWTGELPPPRDLLIAHARGKQALLTMLTDSVDTALLDALPDLKVVANCAVGVNNIDLVAARARKIAVGNTPDVLTDATADLAFALLMAGARHLVAGRDYVQSGAWRTWNPTLLLGQPVWGATLAVIGYGRIGAAVARRGRGFGMRVLVVSDHLRTEQAGQDNVSIVSRETAFAEADFVSVHTPLRADTHHLIGARELALMKPTAGLINTARGEIIDPVALEAALRAGRPGFAALDVTEPEPIPVDHPLLTLPNCLIIPHLGSATDATRRAMTDRAFANIRAGVRGEPLPFGVVQL